MKIAQEEIFGPVQSIFKFKWVPFLIWLKLWTVCKQPRLIPKLLSNIGTVVHLSTVISTRSSRGRTRAATDWPPVFSPTTWAQPTPWHVRSGLGLSGWTASTSSTRRSPSAGTRWVASVGRRASTAWRTTYKRRQSSPQLRTPRGCDKIMSKTG